MKKTDNKGFSLVELIIVIAIMVILVAVIAPQYTKFVFNSRISTDVQTAAEMATALDVAIADGSYAPSLKTDYEGKMSKLNGAAGGWAITLDENNGVQEITLTYDSKTYVVYPNPDGTSTKSGLAQLKK